MPSHVVEFVGAIVVLPRPLVDQDGQVAGVTDEQTIVEASVELPAGVRDAPLYLFPRHRFPLLHDFGVPNFATGAEDHRR